MPYREKHGTEVSLSHGTDNTIPQINHMPAESFFILGFSPNRQREVGKNYQVRTKNRLNFHINNPEI